MTYVRLRDLIEFAYYTWCFSFEDLEGDLSDVLKLAIKEGINEIGLDNGKVIYLGEYDLDDITEYLTDEVRDILQDIEHIENEEIL